MSLMISQSPEFMDSQKTRKSKYLENVSLFFLQIKKSLNVQRPCSMAIVFFLVSLFRFLLRFWEPLIFRIIHCSCWIECWQKNSIPVFVYLGFFAKKKVIARLAYDHTKRGYGHTKHTFNILVQLSPLLLSHTHSFLICYLKLSFFYTFAHILLI